MYAPAIRRKFDRLYGLVKIKVVKDHAPTEVD